MHGSIYTHDSKRSTYGLSTTSLPRHSIYVSSKVTCSQKNSVSGKRAWLQNREGKRLADFHRRGVSPSNSFRVMLAMCKAHASRTTFVLGRYFPNDTGLTH